MIIPRALEPALQTAIANNPVTAILGPRQCGKSTLAKHYLRQLPPSKPSIYLDLERPSDLRKLDDPEWFLSTLTNHLVCIDEIQRLPELFPILRALVDQQIHSDQTDQNGQYLILGSASRDLIKQSSETLAGRITYKKLTPFTWEEIQQPGIHQSGSLQPETHQQEIQQPENQSADNPQPIRLTLETYLYKGGFPKSLLTPDDRTSYDWRSDFITTFLERDLLQFAGFTPQTMRRLWTMLAHTNGQTANLSQLASSLGVSHTTIRNYIDLLEGTFMVRQLQPYRGNTQKRLVKTPKVYITDTGITTALLGLRSYEQTAGHPVFGSLWETIVLEQVSARFPTLELSFYRTSHGNEVDLVLSDGSRTCIVECKATQAPSLSKGNHAAIHDLQPEQTFVAIPAETGYPMQPSIQAVSLLELIETIPQFLSV